MMNTDILFIAVPGIVALAHISTFKQLGFICKERVGGVTI